MSKSVNNSAFNQFLQKLGEQPLGPAVGDVDEATLAFEISEMEDRLGITNEKKEQENEDTK